jgi:hypothetical protein
VQQQGQELIARGSRDFGQFGPPGGGPTNFPGGPGEPLPPPPTAALAPAPRAAAVAPPPTAAPARTANTASPLGGRARGPLLSGGGFTGGFGGGLR